MATAHRSGEIVQIKRTFAAPREKVFEAWTNPVLMARWFARAPKHPPTKVIEAEVREGGKYRIEVLGEKLYRGRGVYREVRRPELLVFTWNWEHHEFVDSLVTVEFRTLGQSNLTEVTLTHELLPQKDREAHRKGWAECFDMLEKALAEPL